eukprot:TRINITY_DN1114_c0_g1_i2.p1 TRINITY_DN1114_c0_g1~~TRINITY_DN1114_c0_g1_i2.p1  ORF type:complete len:728 (+),score=108.76 TRINITY_DN1114_c0_g1_i2:44-2227(+)
MLTFRFLVLTSSALFAWASREIEALNHRHGGTEDTAESNINRLSQLERYDEIALTQGTHSSYYNGREPEKAIDGDPKTYSQGEATYYSVAYFKAKYPLAIIKKAILYSVEGKEGKFRRYSLCVRRSGSEIECQYMYSRVSTKGTVIHFEGLEYSDEVFVIQGSYDSLPVAEVRLFGRYILEQVPLFSPQMVGWTSEAESAEQGLTNNKWSHFKTGYTSDAWWEADLGSIRHIYRVYMFTYLPEASDFHTFKIILSRNPITASSAYYGDYDTVILYHALSSYSRSGGVYPDPWIGFSARYIRIEKESIFSSPLSLTNVQVFAKIEHGKHNQNWGFTTTGCARLHDDTEDLENHAVNCGTDTSGLLSGFAMREHSDCSGNEYKMESYCTNAKTGGSCSTRQTSCMNLKSGLESITQSVDCSSIGGIKDWQVVGSDCSSNQRRISYTCCPLDSSGVSRVESTPCVEVDGQPASDAFLLYRPHCLENEVMSKWEFVSDCSDSKFRRIAFTCLQVNTVTLPRVRAENIQLVTHETSSWQEILSDINTECDGSTIGLCLTQHWYEMEFVDYPNSRITRSSGWDLRWEDEDDVAATSVPRCRYFKIATLNKFSSSGSRNAWIVGHDCESDGGVRMITVTSDGVVSYASNTNPLSRPLYMWSSYDTSYDFKICTVFDVRMTQSGDCSSDLFSCRVSSLSFTQANVQRISATSTGAIGGTGGYSDIRFKKVMLDGN